ncbi:hypothetical protein AnigIFM49718_011149 [Aspergillus niger]|nr:hypothetical protein AnigIFM49718_011149 [Aspergillus niger]GLA10934.1 hypothetical protein AnigIFM62618_000534 [Aspergillus niger]
MAVNYRHGLSILELIVYLPSLFISLFMGFRHGFQRNAGWILLIIFSLARVVAGMVLCIVGSSMSSSLQGITNSIEAKVGDVLYVIAWACLCVLLLVVGSKYASIEDGEHRLLLAVGVSVPLLLVRLIYSLLSVFTHNPTFNMFTGNVTVFLVMAVLEEIVIVGICLGVGMTLEVRQRPTEYEACEAPAQGSSELESQQRPDMTSYNPKKQERRQKKRRGGPISQLIGLAIDEIRSRRK